MHFSTPAPAAYCRLGRLVVAAMLCAGLQQAPAAPPQMTFLFPAGGERGQTVKVAATGSFESWPLEAWCDTPGVTVACGTEKGQLQIALDAALPPGVSYFRLHAQQGATSLRPFVVGHLPEVLEQEPNDDPRKPQQISEKAVTVNGQLLKKGDVDGFGVSLKKGEMLVASLVAHEQLGSPFDAVLQVVSESGFVLAQNDDERGLDPQLAFTAPRDGTYLVRIFGFPAVADSSINFAGANTFVYRLALAGGAPWVDYSLPLAARRGETAPVELHGWNLPDDLQTLAPTISTGGARAILFDPRLANFLALPVSSHAAIVERREKPGAVQRLELPVSVTGRIEAKGEIDGYVFAAKKGEPISCQVESRELGFPLDPVLTALDGGGKQLGRADDAGGKDARDAQLQVTPTADGDVELRVTDLHRQGGPRYVYRLTVAAEEPDFRLSAPEGEYVATVGKPLEIAVTVERLGGLTEEIELTAIDLPEGVTAEKVVAKAGEGEARDNRGSGRRRGSSRAPAGQTFKMTFKAEKPGVHGRFRIAGACIAEPKLERIASAAIKDCGAKTVDLWFTVPPAP